MKSEVTIVMYHYVRDLKNSRYPNIKGLDIEKFKKQIKFFKENHCSDITLSQPKLGTQGLGIVIRQKIK